MALGALVKIKEVARTGWGHNGKAVVESFVGSDAAEEGECVSHQNSSHFSAYSTRFSTRGNFRGKFTGVKFSNIILF